MKKKINIDVTKCLGCRKGISHFTKKDGEYRHFDLFASPEAGAIYRCENTDTIGEYLTEGKPDMYYTEDDDIKYFFDQQGYWWEDIIDLAYAFDKDAQFSEMGIQPGEKLHELLQDNPVISSEYADKLSIKEIKELIDDTY